MNTTKPNTNFGPRVLAGAVAVILLGAMVLGGLEARADVASTVAAMPDCDKGGKYAGPAPDVATKAVQEILQGSEDSIVALVNMLTEPGKGEDYKAYYLLHAVCTHVRRPGAEQERKMVCDALGSTLAADRPAFIRGRVLEELKWIGGPESVGPIGKFLLDETLYDFAVQALVARKAAEPIRDALPKAKGRNRVALIQALGTLRDAEAVASIIEATKVSDTAVRLAAVEALGNIGDARGVEAVLAVAKLDKATYDEMKAAEAALRLAERLAEAGNKDQARRVYAALSKSYVGKAGRHVRAGCLQGLAAVAGEEILTDLLAALADPDPQVRAVAAATAAALPGGNMIDKWLGMLKTAPTQDRAGILFIVGAIGDAKALPAVLAAMNDADTPVRHEAMRAAAAIGGDQAAEALLTPATGGNDADRQVALESLAKCRGQQADGVVAAAIAKAPNASAKAALLEVLGARRAAGQMDVILAALGDADATIRVAAARALAPIGGGKEAAALLKMLRAAKAADERGAAEEALLAVGLRDRDATAEAITAELAGANADAAAAMVRVLGRLGGASAAKALTACASSTDAKVSDEAIRALANWRDNNGMNEAQRGLLAIARTDKDPRHQALAIRQYAALARQRYRRDPLKQAKACGEALTIASRPEDKRYILGVLGDIQHVESVKLAAACLKDKDVVEEAAAAVVRIVKKLPNKTDRAVQAALRQITLVSSNQQTVKDAKGLLINQP